MNIISSLFLSYILLYGYTALFLISLLAVLVPLPSIVVLLSAGAFAGQGYLNIYFVIICAAMGNVFGDVIYFTLARKYGKEFLMKIGLKKMILSKNFTSMESFINKNTGLTIFITRIVPLGSIVDILGGLSKISFGSFMLFSVTGNFVYVVGIGLTGYFLGNAWQDVSSIISTGGMILIVIILISVLGRIYYRKFKHK